MRRIKVLGLAAVAALACMAIVGTSSAFANETVLCSSNTGSECPGGEIYLAGTSLKASASETVKFETSLGNVKCPESSLEGKTSAWSGEPLAAEVSAWTIGGCKLGTSKCTASALNLPYSASVAYQFNKGNGTMTLKGSGGEVGWAVNCGAGLNCNFSSATPLHVGGGSPASLSADYWLKGVSGSCPSGGATFVAPLTITSPQPLYVRSVPLTGTMFCKENAWPCTEAAVYEAHTGFKASLTSGTTANLETGLGTIKCSESSFAGETTAESGKKALPATINSFSLSGCSLGGQSCTATSESLPYSTTFGWTSKETAQMIVAGFGFNTVCVGINCKYYGAGGEAFFGMTGGSPATLTINEELERSGSSCPFGSVLNAKYQITSPSPLYLTRE
jgi:hypothetical protein